MALVLKHPYTAVGVEFGTGEVGKDEWNASHTVTGTPNKLLGFDGSGNPTDYDPNAVTGGFSVTGTLVLLNDFSEKVYSNGTGTSFTLSLSNGTFHGLTTNGATTITLPASVAGKSYIVLVYYGGVHVITWAGGSTLKWAGGSTPTTTSVAGKYDMFSFICNGSITFGQMIGKGY